MIFKLYESDLGLTIRGTNYDFTEVDNFTIEDNERTRLTRGSNAGNKIGIAYREGIKDAKVITVTVIGLPLELHNLLKDVYSKSERIDVYCINRNDGSSKIGKNAVLSQEPKQLTLDDSAESMNTALVFETYDISEVHKS